MKVNKAGSIWLVAYFELAGFQLTRQSYIGTRDKIELGDDVIINQTYGPKYAPQIDTVFSHIEFMLKYDDFNLDLLLAIFCRVEEQKVTSYILGNPNGRYSRRIGYLYEWLTGKKLKMAISVGGNYIDLLDPERYITGKIIKNTRWPINDNLLGVSEFCPVVRKPSL